MTKLRIDTKLAQWPILRAIETGFGAFRTGFGRGGKALQVVLSSALMAGMRSQGFGSDGWNRTTDLGVMKPFGRFSVYFVPLSPALYPLAF
jgi:hypothetical protein